MLKTVLLLGGSLWGAAVLGSVQAAENTSRYSDLDFAYCEILEEDSEFGFVQLKCAGAYGYDVYATEADLRFYLAFKPVGFVVEDPAEIEVLEPAKADGKNIELPLSDDNSAEEARDIGQTLGPFNTLGPRLEWRAANATGAMPFATIVRYHYQTMGDEGSFVDGQVLVVSRFRAGESCHVGYVDALANADANLMARELADTFADGGTCPEGAVPVVGDGGEAFRF